MDAFGAVIFRACADRRAAEGAVRIHGRGSRSLEELSRETGLSHEGIRLLAEACVAGGYLECTKGLYRTAAEGKKWLVKDSETYLGDLIYYLTRSTRGSQGWTTLWNTEDPGNRTTRHSPIRTGRHTSGDGEPRAPPYAGSHQENPAPGGGRSPARSRGSHGLYALECCRSFPGCTAVVMDFAPALRWATAIDAGDPRAVCHSPPEIS